MFHFLFSSFFEVKTVQFYGQSMQLDLHEHPHSFVQLYRIQYMGLFGVTIEICKWSSLVWGPFAAVFRGILFADACFEILSKQPF